MGKIFFFQQGKKYSFSELDVGFLQLRDPSVLPGVKPRGAEKNNKIKESNQSKISQRRRAHINLNFILLISW
jgi:hypothetical protein